MLLRPVTFGSLVLQQLYTVIDLNYHRLGFRQQVRQQRGTHGHLLRGMC